MATPNYHIVFVWFCLVSDGVGRRVQKNAEQVLADSQMGGSLFSAGVGKVETSSDASPVRPNQAQNALSTLLKLNSPATAFSASQVPTAGKAPAAPPGHLDALPVFAVANKEGKPLQYQVNGQPMAVFYADIDVAKNELESAKSKNPTLECDIVPVGLGAANDLSESGKATIVPGLAELTAAGMPAGMPAFGQELPLFTCMEMTRETEEGGKVLPVFMSFTECEAAVKQAREATGTDLQIVPLSLQSVLEHTSSGGTPLEFIAPSSSTDHISRYVGSTPEGKAIYARVVDDE